MKTTLIQFLSALFLSVSLPASFASGQDKNGQTKSLAFTEVTVIDMTGGPPKTGMTVIINGNRIAAVGKSTRTKIPPGTRVIDSKGKYLIPGLWDMHVHLDEGDHFFPLFIVNGVTGVRDMGSLSRKAFETLKQLRGQITKGEMLGPHIFTSGPMLDGPRSFSADDRIVVRTEGEARQSVKWLKQNGADFVKVHSFPSREVYLSIAGEARKRKLPLVGHIPSAMRVSEAIDAGQKDIEHTLGLHVACSDREEELRRPLLAALDRGDDFDAIIRADVEASDSYDSRKAMGLFTKMVEKNVWVCPTLLASQLSTLSSKDFLEHIGLEFYPPTLKDKLTEQVAFPSKEAEERSIQTNKRLFIQDLKLVGEMQKAGIQLLAGTDAMPGFGLNEELQLMVGAGLKPMEALRTATYNPAKYLGILDKFGTIESGKMADLVLLDANPLADIRNTKKIRAVVRGGTLIDQNEINTILERVKIAAR